MSEQEETPAKVRGHARQCGARILKSPTEMPFGERQYTADDPWGHRWRSPNPLPTLP